MKFNEKFIGQVVGKFQEGGAMPSNEPVPANPEANAPAPAEAPAPAPEEQMQQFAGQLVQMLLEQVGDPALVSQILQMALDMVSQAAPAPAQFQRLGGKLTRKN